MVFTFAMFANLYAFLVGYLVKAFVAVAEAAAPRLDDPNLINGMLCLLFAAILIKIIIFLVTGTIAYVGFALSVLVVVGIVLSPFGWTSDPLLSQKFAKAVLEAMAIYDDKAGTSLVGKEDLKKAREDMRISAEIARASKRAVDRIKKESDMENMSPSHIEKVRNDWLRTPEAFRPIMPSMEEKILQAREDDVRFKRDYQRALKVVNDKWLRQSDGSLRSPSELNDEDEAAYRVDFRRITGSVKRNTAHVQCLQAIKEAAYSEEPIHELLVLSESDNSIRLHCNPMEVPEWLQAVTAYLDAEVEPALFIAWGVIQK